MRYSGVLCGPDKSNGYERIAPAFISARGQSHGGVGAIAVSEWARSLRRGAKILDLGCGTGVPITESLLDLGFSVFAVDASPTMVSAFRIRFPGVPVQCAAAEDSDFFGESFDAVVAWGLIFLLSQHVQRELIARIAAALKEGGRLLFTAPSERCSWTDTMTGLPSFSLGMKSYLDILGANRMQLIDTRVDEGENHYYFAGKHNENHLSVERRT